MERAKSKEEFSKNKTVSMTPAISKPVGQLKTYDDVVNNGRYCAANTLILYFTQLSASTLAEIKENIEEMNKVLDSIKDKYGENTAALIRALREQNRINKEDLIRYCNEAAYLKADKEVERLNIVLNNIKEFQGRYKDKIKTEWNNITNDKEKGKLLTSLVYEINNFLKKKED
eukprot:TRINITY_DN10942_c0_g3_i10.p1 TRINITY_DN10942_c0_g3~~TRINITY_DN10942_c0_g3_i10.p1  ORF type:complete len:173 (-),score=22.64 TRINITY_DN10942_c0_g3_i10:163-681(-)